MADTLDINSLAGLKDLAIELRNNPRPLSKEYFEKDAKMVEERNKEYEKQKKSLQMSYEKLHTPFNC